VFGRVVGRLCRRELRAGAWVADVGAATTARFDVVLATQSA
jgi:hypothetical protein